MSGPRLCSLRIPNGGGNVLIDNIEADSTPVIYTRRSRFLDEELDETKDIITTTSPYPSVNGCAEQRTYHKISMLMSDGVVAAMPTVDANPEIHSLVNNHNKMCDPSAIDMNALEIAQNYDECNQLRDECDQPNQTYCTNTTHIPSSDSIGLDRGFNGLTLNDHDLSQNGTFGQPMNDSIAINGSDSTNLKEPMDGTDKQSNQFMHIRQFRQSHQMSIVDDTSLLRRQQLSRVAEWVQNNNHETCLANPDNDYKTITKLNNNRDEMRNRSVDRNLKSLSMINCNNLTNNDLDVGKYSKFSLFCVCVSSSMAFVLNVDNIFVQIFLQLRKPLTTAK